MQLECAPGEAGEIGTARQRRYYRPEDREQLLEGKRLARGVIAFAENALFGSITSFYLPS
jgi:hypothetical protein